MLPAGRMGGGDRGGSKKSPVKDVSRSTLSGLSSEEFNKAWLTLKEAHEKELGTLQGQLTSLRRQQVADRRRADTHARVRELTRQQQVLNDTIDTLRIQLNTRTCDRCTSNEESKRSLQQEFYLVQQRNLKFIADLTEERNKLREENKRLSAKLNQDSKRSCLSNTDTNDDFITNFQKPGSGFSTRDPTTQPRKKLLEKPLTQLPAKLPVEPQAPAQSDLSKSPVFPGQLPSSDLSTPLSQDISVVPETSFEKISSDTGMSSVISLKGPLPRKKWFQVPLSCSSPAKSKVDLPVTKCDTTSIQKDSKNDQFWFRFGFGGPSTSSEKNRDYLVSETSEENMPRYKGPTAKPSQAKEKLPLDCTLKARGGRPMSATAPNDTRFTAKDTSIHKAHNEPPALTQATEPKADDTDSSLGQSTVKRKVKILSTRKRK